jgi:oligosaccharide 4-alpha-D-glucosyltransferase
MRARILLATLSLGLTVTASADVMDGLTDWARLGDRFVFRSGTPALAVTAYTDHIVRVELFPDGNVQPDTSLVVILPPQPVSSSFTQDSVQIYLQLGSIEVTVSRSPLRLRFSRGASVLLEDDDGLFWDHEQRGVRFHLSDEEGIYGGGERAVALNHRGQILNSYNAPQYCYGYGAPDLSITVPFLSSSRLWAVYFDDPYPGWADMGFAQADVLEYGVHGGQFTYYFVAGNSTSELLKYYTDLTGRQPLPPLWSLGFLQSRFGYHSSAEARAVVTAFRQEHIPLDAIILDLYWFGWGHMGDFDWDYGAWPDPSGMMHDFDSLGVKTILITEPYILQSSSNYSTASSSGYLAHDSANAPVVIPDFWAGSASLLDLTNPAAADWMWSFYAARMNQGVGGWWCDLGEPEAHPSNMLHYAGSAARVHNTFSLLWAKRIYEGFRAIFPQKRLFNLIRSGYAGMQRYSTFPWSGDVQRQFPGLQAQIPILLSMGLSGVPFTGCDLGGFDCGPLDTELYIRWMQFGAFSPTMRAHGVGVTTEPVYFDPATRSTVTDYIRLRYALLPYNYTLAWRSTRDGTPLARPLFWNQTGGAPLDEDDQYLWGNAFLVAPVIESGQTSREVHLPHGDWFNYWTDQPLSGESWITAEAPLDKLPLFVRAGSFVPMIPPIETTRDYHTDTLFVHVYPQREPFADTLYNDDGVTPDAFSLGQYETVHFAADMPGDDLLVNLSRTNFGYAQAPASRKMIFIVHALSAGPNSVSLCGHTLSATDSLSQLLQSDSVYFWNASEHRLYVGFTWNGGNAQWLARGVGSSVPGRAAAARSFTLSAHPNPFNASTIIEFELPSARRVQVTVFDALGRQVAVLADEHLSAGRHTCRLDAHDWSSGIYFCRLTTGKQTLTARLLLLK